MTGKHYLDIHPGGVLHYGVEVVHLEPEQPDLSLDKEAPKAVIRKNGWSL